MPKRASKVLRRRSKETRLSKRKSGNATKGSGKKKSKARSSGRAAVTRSYTQGARMYRSRKGPSLLNLDPSFDKLDSSFENLDPSYENLDEFKLYLQKIFDLITLEKAEYYITRPLKPASVNVSGNTTKIQLKFVKEGDIIYFQLENNEKKSKLYTLFKKGKQIGGSMTDIKKASTDLYEKGSVLGILKNLVKTSRG